MKTTLLIITAFIFGACSGNPQAENIDPNKEKIISKNNQTAIINEVTLITTAAQKLEKEGRGMEIYRNSVKAESLRQCNLISADEQKQVQDLADRITKLPESYNPILTPIIGDLNECVACSKKAAESCVKARASINKAIKQLYP
ncbi:MAG: hypothetical protein LH472_08130 [Pyrinomonadaceae bacterium]|nr:hypothetical protein [Pyrinomonadaceae bacterium]